MSHETWMISSEIAPLAQAGGLGEVLRALPFELAHEGMKVRSFMPAYGCVDRTGFFDERIELKVPLGDARVPVRFLTRRETTGLMTTLVENEAYFGRKEIYGPPGGEYPDNARRFALFCRAICEYAWHTSKPPQVFHVHDWPAALVPMYAKLCYQWENAPRSVYTIHNLAYQGRFKAAELPWLGLTPEQSAEVFQPNGIEYYGDISFMKAGLLYADHITTVSPTYSQDILTSEYGAGMEGVIGTRESSLTGILNGADYNVWNPAKDPYLPEKYTTSKYLRAKTAAQKVVRTELGMDPLCRRPMLGMVGRITEQKGIDFLIETAVTLMGHGTDICILGEGDPALTKELQNLQDHLPRRFGLRLAFDKRMSHLIMAGSDCMLIPSRYEPCGLTQMYALKYGTIPIAFGTGGLMDTIIDVHDDPKRGTGFLFHEYTAEAFLACVDRALELRKKDIKKWRTIQKRGMRQDFSWTEAARQYGSLYEGYSPQLPSRKSDVRQPAVAR